MYKYFTDNGKNLNLNGFSKRFVRDLSKLIESINNDNVEEFAVILDKMIKQYGKKVLYIPLDLIDLIKKYLEDKHIFSKDHKCIKGYTLWQIALLKRSYRIFEYLFKLKLYNSNEPYDCLSNRPLHLAASLCDKNAIEILIKYGANLHSLNKLGKSPLNLLSKCNINLYSGI